MDDVATVEALEVELLSPTTRRSPDRLAQLLDDDFQEIGASGRLWTKAQTLEALPAQPGHAPIPHTDLTGRLVGPDLVLLTYVSDPDGRRARRSSLWRRSTTGWRLLHHQGTLC